MVSQQPFEVASNSATSPSNFETASYQREKISTETKLGTIPGVQGATNLRSATTTSFNAQQSAVNDGATKPPRLFAKDLTQPPAPNFLTQ
jgi:uncharacterized membrane protein